MQGLYVDSNLKKFSIRYQKGETLFLEGDAATDLYILVSGELDIFKGPKKISEIRETGQIFGEMAFLVGEKRTATIQAASPVEAIKIPGAEVTGLLQKVPDFGVELARTLARRLQNTTTMAYGLKEFCDQLPDAVMITTDQDQKIMAWNAAAERLYGRTAEEMRDLPLKEIYSDTEAYEKLQQSLSEGKTTSAQEMQVRLPGGSKRLFVSASTTMLYDGHYNIQGLLFLARDVTKLHELENKYRKIRNWLIPSFALLGLMAALFFYALPAFNRGSQILNYKENSFRRYVDKGHAILASALTAAGARGDYNVLLARYFAAYKPGRYGIRGIILLNPEKTAVAAYLPGTAAPKQQIVGSSYGGLSLSTDRQRPVSLLTLFRPTPDHPMGKKIHELAWRLQGNRKIGWLVFQLNMDYLEKEFGLDAATLKSMRFNN